MGSATLMGGASPRPAPTFLIAPRRSGSAALRHILVQHPRIMIAPDFDFLVDAITPEGRFLKREAFLRSIEFDSRFKRLGLTIPPGASFSGIAQSLIDQVAATRPGASVVGATLQHHFDRILWLWPEARFIHMVRDGRDVAIANVRAGQAGNMWHGIANWVDTEALWDRMSHKLPPDRQFTIKYEALTSDPEYELRRLCGFLRLPFEPAMLQQTGGLTSEPAGRWRKAEVAEISAAEHRAARWLLQSGYFLSGTVRSPSFLRRGLLGIQDRVALANHRREQFGTGLWLKGLMIGRFGTGRAKSRMKRRQYDILSRQDD